MDAAEYDTNILVVNNIASISFRVYEPSSDQSSSFGLAAIDIENSLREKGHIVYYDASRRGIWHFRIVGKEGSDEVSSQELDSSLSLRGYSLIVGEEGSFEPSSLPRPRSQQPQTGHTPTSSTSSASALDQSQRYAPTATSHLGPPGLQEQDSKGYTSVTDAKLVQGGSSSPKAYESFVVATLLTIQSAFCRHTDSIPLNYRTVLLSQDILENDGSFDVVTEKTPTIGTFSGYLTTTGVLVVCMGISICRGLLSYGDMLNQAPDIPGQQILAAPFGVIASNQPAAQFDGGTASMAQTPNTQALSLRGAPDIHNSLWKQACLKFLQLRGVAQSKLTDCFWINLLISKPKLQDAKSDVKRSPMPNSTVTIPWPSPLCFRKRPVEVSSTSRVGETILRGHEESHDPLGNAQSWFSSTPERDEKISKRKAERVATSSEGFGGDSRPTRLNGQSPLTLRRPSTAAAGSMYPTPPDALQNANGVTPSLDGTLSSPGNPLSAAAVPEVDNNGSVSMAMGDSFEPVRDFSESKRQRSDSNLLGEADHMFGDMGQDMFGDNDITEADFNFFDEEPEDIDLEAALDEMGDATTAAIIGAEEHTADEEISNSREPIKEEPEIGKDAGGFTKPELRHAISVQNDHAMPRGRESRPVSMKRESSPFDPHTVFKRVCASFAATEKDGTIATDTNRMTKIFEKMDFDPTLPMINKKYEQGGQFDYSMSTAVGNSRLDHGVLPETDYLKRHGKLHRGSQEHKLYTKSLMGPLSGLERPISGRSPTKLDTQMSDDEQSSTESDQDDSSYTSDEPTSPPKSSVKQAPVEEDAVSQVTSLKEQDVIEEPDHQLAIELPRLSKPETPELPLSMLFSDPEPLALELSLGDEDLIQAAQILTEQAATGSLDLCNTDRPANTSIISQGRATLLSDSRTALQQLREALSVFLRGVEPVRLKAFLDIQDVLLQGQPRMQPRPIPGRDANAEQIRPSNLYQIPGPHLEVRRSDAKLSVLPSAVAFWESLGLAPSSGSKDITAVCVFPGWKGMADNVKTFLGRIKSVYEVLRLGSFENMALASDMDSGVLPYEMDRISTSPDATLTGHGSALIGTMETLRASLSNLTVSDTNVVVYFVYSPNNPGTIVEACAAFQRFFDSYQKDLAAKKETATNELVLQLVSSDLLSSPTSVVVTPSVDLVRLCMETYDRCTLFGGPMPAPAIRLEQPLPRIIDFKLNTQPSMSLIRENSCIHVAYAQTVDGRWVTTAWTDDRGNQQATASYCLGRKGRPLSTSMSEVAYEIWQSTLDLISAWTVHWRVIITKCGPMDQQEIDSWVNLAHTETRLQVTMILMTVDTDPWLQLVPSVVKLPHASVPFYTTPVSTPQANIVSPEQSATPATPANVTAATPGGGEAGADTETDAILADVTDQTWGAIVGHRLNNSLGVTDLYPALVSGFLIKRTGARAEDVPIAMEVNLIHTEAFPRSYEPLLREMLSYFRGLATLSRARGMVSRETDVRPWHIAAAEKAARAMYLLM